MYTRRSMFLKNFLSLRHFDIWVPSATADSTTRQFYEGLGILSIRNTKPGKEPNVHADKLIAMESNRSAPICLELAVAQDSLQHFWLWQDQIALRRPLQILGLLLCLRVGLVHPICET